MGGEEVRAPRFGSFSPKRTKKRHYASQWPLLFSSPSSFLRITFAKHPPFTNKTYTSPEQHTNKPVFATTQSYVFRLFYAEVYRTRQPAATNGKSMHNAIMAQEIIKVWLLI
jgi:hypothetical protein